MAPSHAPAAIDVIRQMLQKDASADKSHGIGDQNLFTETSRKSADPQCNAIQCTRVR